MATMIGDLPAEPFYDQAQAYPPLVSLGPPPRAPLEQEPVPFVADFAAAAAAAAAPVAAAAGNNAAAAVVGLLEPIHRVHQAARSLLAALRRQRLAEGDEPALRAMMAEVVNVMEEGFIGMRVDAQQPLEQLRDRLNPMPQVARDMEREAMEGIGDDYFVFGQVPAGVFDLDALLDDPPQNAALAVPDDPLLAQILLPLAGAGEPAHPNVDVFVLVGRLVVSADEDRQARRVVLNRNVAHPEITILIQSLGGHAHHAPVVNPGLTFIITNRHPVHAEVQEQAINGTQTIITFSIPVGSLSNGRANAHGPRGIIQLALGLGDGPELFSLKFSAVGRQQANQLANRAAEAGVVRVQMQWMGRAQETQLALPWH